MVSRESFWVVIQAAHGGVFCAVVVVSPSQSLTEMVPITYLHSNNRRVSPLSRMLQMTTTDNERSITKVHQLLTFGRFDGVLVHGRACAAFSCIYHNTRDGSHISTASFESAGLTRARVEYTSEWCAKITTSTQQHK